jgi:hypothetical protein
MRVLIALLMCAPFQSVAIAISGDDPVSLDSYAAAWHDTRLPGIDVEAALPIRQRPNHVVDPDDAHIPALMASSTYVPHASAGEFAQFQILGEETLAMPLAGPEAGILGMLMVGLLSLICLRAWRL